MSRVSTPDGPGLPQAPTFITIDKNDPEPTKPYIDYWGYSKRAAHYLVASEQVAADKGVFWNYTPSHQRTPVSSRLYSGFIMWGRGITGRFRWHHLFEATLGIGDNGLDIFWNPATKTIVDNIHELYYFLPYPSLTEDEPTIGREMMREGIDDYKYAYTLQQRIEQVKGLGKAGKVSPQKVKRAKEIEGSLSDWRLELQ